VIVDEGDPGFDEFLNKLTFVRMDNWAHLYEDHGTGELWDITYPHGEMHGGGPRRLRLLDHRDQNAWQPYPSFSTSR
jgi:hypothetical protein